MLYAFGITLSVSQRKGSKFFIIFSNSILPKLTGSVVTIVPRSEKELGLVPIPKR